MRKLYNDFKKCNYNFVLFARHILDMRRRKKAIKRLKEEAINKVLELHGESRYIEAAALLVSSKISVNIIKTHPPVWATDKFKNGTTVYPPKRN